MLGFDNVLKCWDSLMADAEVSTVVRAFAVMDLFSLATPVVGVDDVVRRLGYTRSTSYRYMRELVEAGLVTPGAGGNYSLGARIIELDEAGTREASPSGETRWARWARHR